MSSPITTHALDLATGQPAGGLGVRLERLGPAGFELAGAGHTDDDGRHRHLLPPGADAAGTWRLRFDTGAYWSARGVAGFYPYVEVVFVVDPSRPHHHVPLLLSPFGYSTYRGS